MVGRTPPFNGRHRGEAGTDSIVSRPGEPLADEIRRLHSLRMADRVNERNGESPTTQGQLSYVRLAHDMSGKLSVETSCPDKADQKFRTSERSPQTPSSWLPGPADRR